MCCFETGLMPKVARLVGAVLTVSVLAGCVTPAFDHGAFRRNAVGAIGSGLSETRTAALAVGALLDGKVTSPFANIVITDSESALGPIQATFGNVDPPTPAGDALRDDVLALLGDAQDSLAEARIAARRGDRLALRKAQASLRKIGDRLQQAGERLG
jgi:hypothetical protein